MIFRKLFGSLAVCTIGLTSLPAMAGAYEDMLHAIRTDDQTAIVALFNLDELGVSVLGPVPSGLPSIALPQVPLADYLKLLPGALAIWGVTLAEGLLIARKYAQKYGDKIDPDQEMFAFGLSNAAAGLSR